MTYPVVTMIVGAAIFALGLYCKVWPAAEVPHVAKAETSSPAGPSFNFQGPSNNQFNFPPQATPKVERDPDTLYQLTNPVGQVEKAAVDLAAGTVTFDLVRGAMNLNTNEDFEYRTYKLHIVQMGAEAGSRESRQGRYIERRIYKVVCRIVS